MDPGAAVCSGRCVDVPGFPQQLCSMLRCQHFDRMPEYTTYLQDHGSGKEYVAEVLVHARGEPDGDSRPYRFLGRGIDEEMAIRDAAYVAMTRLRQSSSTNGLRYTSMSLPGCFGPWISTGIIIYFCFIHNQVGRL